MKPLTYFSTGMAILLPFAFIVNQMVSNESPRVSEETSRESAFKAPGNPEQEGMLGRIRFSGRFHAKASFASERRFTRPANLPQPVSDEDYYEAGKPSAAKVELGRMLFFDKILSGNQNISCATCHHPDFASGDGVALPLGEGAHGLGPSRRTGTALDQAVHDRVPRNSPALFNLGTLEYTRMFHDGRVELDTEGYYEAGFITPAKWKLHRGLDNVLAAQAMFPITSPDEMAGQKGENPVANARSMNNVAGPGGVWYLLAERLRENPEYVDLFRAAYPDEILTAEDLTMVQAANAIAAFEGTAFRSDHSPFDGFLRGDTKLAEPALRGMELFYGKANCASCHAGSFQTDHEFYAIAMPQIGPGKADGSHPGYWRETGLNAFLEDFGRGRVTFREKDLFKFRTPSLRNVTLTGPWGHSGAYKSLEAVVRHHLDPVGSLEAYQMPEGLLQPLDAVVELTADGPRLQAERLTGERLTDYLKRDIWVLQQSELRHRIASANELPGQTLTESEVGDVLAFLETLTDPAAGMLEGMIPSRVPSGLPVED